MWWAEATEGRSHEVDGPLSAVEKEVLTVNLLWLQEEWMDHEDWVERLVRAAACRRSYVHSPEYDKMNMKSITKCLVSSVEDVTKRAFCESLAKYKERQEPTVRSG